MISLVLQKLEETVQLIMMLEQLSALLVKCTSSSTDVLDVTNGDTLYKIADLVSSKLINCEGQGPAHSPELLGEAGKQCKGYTQAPGLN